MAIKPIKPSGGDGLNKMLSIGGAIVTGNPMMLAGALPKSNGSSLLSLGSKLGGGAGSAEPEVDQFDIGQAEALPAQYNPMDTKMKSMQQDPMGMTNEALAMLKDPSIPQDIRDQYAAPLLKYKYYGNKGIA